MSSSGAHWQLWQQGQHEVAHALSHALPVEADLIGFGPNYLLLHFLRNSGLWDVAVGMRAGKLRRGNGKPPCVAG